MVEWADVFANPSFRERTRSDDISWTRSDAGRAAWTTLRHGLPRARDVG